MRGCVARREAAIGSLILHVVAPPEAVRSESIRSDPLDDAALLAAAEQSKHRHWIRSSDRVSLSAAYGSITSDFMVAIRIPHMRRTDIREAAEERGGRPRPNDDVVVGDARPANRSRTAVARRFA